ncbi:MAG TPA: TetR family transcriptional regulator [Ktedonobacterales bacterium]|nr:TetR family transcriptional regulator [Ktedonobacterales bacterium]
MSTKNAPDGQKRASFIEEARRAQLIECAIETMATLGYAQASLAQIARCAGISKSAITYYFSSKEELIEQVVTAILKDSAASIGPQVAAEASPALQLQAYIRSHVAYISAHLTQMRAIMEIVRNVRTEEGKPRYSAPAAEPVRAALEAVLRKGQQAGEFREFDVRVMAVTIRGAIDGLSPYLMANPQVDTKLYAGELVTLFDRATRKA